MSAVTVEGAVVAYDARPVLRGTSLRVEPAMLAAVLGPSGCGKTTLLRLIAGFLRPTAGAVSIGGRRVCGEGSWVPPERRRIGVVPQEGALFPHLDVAGNIAFGLPRGPESRRRVGELLELIGLPAAGPVRPHELSGGMQQRVAVARALAPRPEVVLLDEPFSALDAGLRASVRDDVRRVLAEERTTALLVTHDQDEALSLADTVVVLRDGVVAQAGTAREVYADPVDLGVARFVGDVVELPAEVVDVDRGTVARCALGDIPLTTSPDRATRDAGPALLVLRPEQVRLVAGGSGAGPAAPGATVRGVRFHGADALVRVELDPPHGAWLDARVPAAEGLPSPGSRVALQVVGTGRVFPADG